MSTLRIFIASSSEGLLIANALRTTLQAELGGNARVELWSQHGSKHYPDAKGLLVLCDGGGSNASNRHVFKEALQHLADRLGLAIRIAH